MTYFFAVEDHRVRVGVRVHCKKCEKETAFFRHKCLECGTAFVKLRKGASGKWAFNHARKLQLRGAQLRNDRAAYLKQQAEASRAKFEGKTPDAQKNLPESGVGDFPHGNAGKRDVGVA
jgi:hypothetical protein